MYDQMESLLFCCFHFPLHLVSYHEHNSRMCQLTSHIFEKKKKLTFQACTRGIGETIKHIKH